VNNVKRLLGVPISAGLILLLITLVPSAESVEQNSLNVAVSIEPLAGIVEEVGSGTLSVEVLVPENVEPHTFQASPDIISKATEADLIVLTGHFHFEEQIVEVAKKPAVGLKEFKTYGLTLSPMPVPYESEHAGVNLHGYWLKPSNALAIAKAVKAALIELDPRHLEVYEKGAAQFENKIEAIKQRFSELSEEYELNKLKVAITSPAEAYVAESFGMQVENMLTRGENVFVSGSELAELEEKLRSREVKLILTSDVARQMKIGEFAQQLASDTGTPIVYVRVLVFGGLNDYTALMMYNAGVLAGQPASITGGRSATELQWSCIVAIVALATIIILETSLIMRRRL